MNNVKQWVAVFLAAMMVLLCLSACTKSENTTSEKPSEEPSTESTVETSDEPIRPASRLTEGDYTYILIDDDTHVQIVQYNGTDADVEIPSTIAEKPVIAIGWDQSVTAGDRVFENAESLTSVTLPDSVTTIGALFGTDVPLTTFTVPDGVTVIGPNAFVNCKTLTEITLPASVTEIGFDAFGGCDNLKIIHYAGETGRLTIDEQNETLKNATWDYEYTP